VANVERAGRGCVETLEDWYRVAPAQPLSEETTSTRRGGRASSDRVVRTPRGAPAAREEKEVKTAIGAARAKMASKEMFYSTSRRASAPFISTRASE
jgi:hypothetical protein